MDSVAQDLLSQGGYALVSLSEAQQEVMARGFACGRKALDGIQNNDIQNEGSSVRCILPTDDSAHATGYHPAGGMSRYNSRREGFVFSDGASFSVDSVEEFEPCMKEMQDCLHTIANQVVTELEKGLEIPDTWFQEHYFHEEDHSQWHLKRYITDPTSSSRESHLDGSEERESEETILLPSHTDPSLLSVVVLDSPGQQPGAMGLQVYQRLLQQDENTREWTELKWHGHAIATVFVGSVMSYTTGGRCPSAKHRVVKSVTDRMAATFFLRPKGTAILCVPPSHSLQGVALKKKKATFDSWSSRVSRNYMKQKDQEVKTANTN